jgi:site-specific recombinase XerD
MLLPKILLFSCKNSRLLKPPRWAVSIKHAKAAGLNAPFLGSHVLRHSFAARQIDLGICPRVLSDLLGHHDSESISAYVRIATETLRNVSLPVPT